jgi:hypothetical protein
MTGSRFRQKIRIPKLTCSVVRQERLRRFRIILIHLQEKFLPANYLNRIF